MSFSPLECSTMMQTMSPVCFRDPITRFEQRVRAQRVEAAGGLRRGLKLTQTPGLLLLVPPRTLPMLVNARELDADDAALRPVAAWRTQDPTGNDWSLDASRSTSGVVVGAFYLTRRILRPFSSSAASEPRRRAPPLRRWWRPRFCGRAGASSLLGRDLPIELLA